MSACSRPFLTSPRGGNWTLSSDIDEDSRGGSVAVHSHFLTIIIIFTLRIWPKPVRTDHSHFLIVVIDTIHFLCLGCRILWFFSSSFFSCFFMNMFRHSEAYSYYRILMFHLEINAVQYERKLNKIKYNLWLHLRVQFTLHHVARIPNFNVYIILLLITNQRMQIICNI